MSTAGGSAAEHATRLAARADQVALCLDFDGTLSPIVDDPEIRVDPGLEAGRPVVIFSIAERQLGYGDMVHISTGSSATSGSPTTSP